ncbi:hypothetical protein ALC53_10918 [Atta colombica]|uniref:Mariner Mos1 transposase n=1 Tax=Atta colombica TaxID=520822 RepID=A0A151I067_9HYME|nr:hypothetical protein ALC53_10918 [Atta colombica]
MSRNFLIKSEKNCVSWLSAGYHELHWEDKLISYSLPYELKPRDVERRFFTCEQLIPHVAKVVKIYLETLKASHWFTSFAEIENWLQNWIVSKDESFFRNGIRKLPEMGKSSKQQWTLIDLFIHFVLK